MNKATLAKRKVNRFLAIDQSADALRFEGQSLIRNAKALKRFSRELQRADRELERQLGRALTRPQRKRYDDMRARHIALVSRAKVLAEDPGGMRKLANLQKKAADELDAFLAKEGVQRRVLQAIYRKRSATVQAALTRSAVAPVGPGTEVR